MLLKLMPISRPNFVITPLIFEVFNHHLSSSMLTLKYPPQISTPSFETCHISSNCSSRNVIIKGLSNVKEEVYGALDSFIAWELEFPLITVKKAVKTLEQDKEWKRVIQVTKWMLSKGQGRTMGSYFTLLNALAEEDRLEEAEQLWAKLFSENLESTPRMFFDKMISIYYTRGMHDKMFDVFADMEELGMKPTTSIVANVGDVFQKLGVMDKYEKLKEKYPPPKWEYRYIKGKRVKVQVKRPDESYDEHGDASESDEKSARARYASEAVNNSNEDDDEQSAKT